MNEEMRAFQESHIYPLMTLLRTGLWHRTDIEGFRGIRNTGGILPNRGQFRFTYPQTAGSYAYSMGYVSLFDFESASETDYLRNYFNWQNFFSDRKPVTIVIKLDRQSLAHKLIPHSVRPKPGEKAYKENGYKSAIPFVEAWYPEQIIVAAIDSYIITWQPSKMEKLTFCQFSREELTDLNELLSLDEESLIKAVVKRSRQ